MVYAKVISITLLYEGNSYIIQDTQCAYNEKLRRVRCQCRRGKAMVITYYECVFLAISIQHEKRRRRIVTSSAASLDLPHHSTLYHKCYDFRKKLN